ncbi:hypothetical protein [Streptosporangium sp. NPDC049046]
MAGALPEIVGTAAAPHCPPQAERRPYPECLLPPGGTGPWIVQEVQEV